MTRPSTRRLTTRSALATAALGRRLGRLLRPGDVVALVGDLGAGKTCFVRGVCRGAEVPEQEVSSPSFAIVATYGGRLTVHHAFFFIVWEIYEIYSTGFMDLVGGEGALLVEWADRIDGWLPPEHLLVRMEHLARAPSSRRVTFLPAGERHEALARALARRARRRVAPRGARPRAGGRRSRRDPAR